MQTSYVRYGRRFSIPSTAQILDELKTGFVEGYVPVSGGYKKPDGPETADAEKGAPDRKTRINGSETRSTRFLPAPKVCGFPPRPSRAFHPDYDIALSNGGWSRVKE
jgi:hypothetical protein